MFALIILSAVALLSAFVVLFVGACANLYREEDFHNEGSDELW